MGKDKPDETTEILNGSNTLPANIEIAEGLEVQLGAVVAAAYTASGLSVEDWNGLAEDERDILLNETIENMKAVVAQTAKDEAEAPETPVAEATPEPEVAAPAPVPGEPTDLQKLVKDLEKAYGVSRDKVVNSILERALATANRLLADEQAND
jgi:hypothetical protein